MISTKINYHIEIIELLRPMVYYYNRKVAGGVKKGKSRVHDEENNNVGLHGDHLVM